MHLKAAPANPLSMNNEEILVGDTLFVTCIAPEHRRNAGPFWHVSEAGCLHLLECVRPGTYRYASETADEPNVLSGVKEVDAYLRCQGRHFENCHLPANNRMVRLTNLALYPGYFPFDDSLEHREAVLNALLEGLNMVGDRTAGFRMTRLVALCVLDRGPTPYTAHCMRHLPTRFMGMLAAYGIISPGVWDVRHEEALLEGWRYQLLHPDEKYARPNLDGQLDSPRYMLESDLPLPLRNHLLDQTGLSEADVIRAAEIAGMAEQLQADAGVSHLLAELGRRSTLNAGRELLTMAELPDDVGAE